MKTIKQTVNEGILMLALDRGPANAINMEMMQELNEVFEQAEKDDAIKGVLLTGKENFFSAGLDLMALYELDEAEVKHFWRKFIALTMTLTYFPKPFVVAVSGHSPAGGCVLSLCADYRVMAEGNYGIGLNEVPVGIVVPNLIFKLYAFWLGRKNAYQFLLEGKLVSPAEALSVGLVDEVVAPNKILTAAEKKLRQYASYEPTTWSRSKLNLRQELFEQMQELHTQALEDILEQWWSPSTRNVLKMVIEKLKSGK